MFLAEAFTATPDSIADAVNNKRVMAISYKGDEDDSYHWRNIFPVCFGNDYKGRQAIRAFQENGHTMTFNPAYKFFLVERINNWNLSSNKNFTKPSGKYGKYNPGQRDSRGKVVKGDEHMRDIFAASEFDGSEVNAPLPSKLDQAKGVKTYVVDISKNKAVQVFDDPADAVDAADKMNKGSKPTKTSGFVPLSDKELAKRNIKPIKPTKMKEADKSSKVVHRMKTLKEIYETI
jgi:hypothetical protein